MSSANHTPGPWILITVPTSVGSCHKIGPFPNGSRSETFACVYADGIRKGIDEDLPAARELSANARLIASAPDLLAERDRLKAANAELVAACEASNQCIADLTEVYTNQSSLLILDEAVKSLRDDALKLVRAALAKNQKETV